MISNVLIICVEKRLFIKFKIENVNALKIHSKARHSHSLPKNAVSTEL